MGKKFDFEFIVIGSGPAGSAAALDLARAKKRVAIVEANRFGGSNLNTRDVPERAGMYFSHLYANLRDSAKFGLTAMNLNFNYPTLASWKEHVISEAGGDRRRIYEESGVTCIRGYANFLDGHTIAVGDKKYTASKFILATGSELATSGISGVESVNYLTPETATTLRRAPRAVVVVGGGAAGCEIAEHYAELGAKVLIMEMSGRLLPREDKEVGETLANYFTNKLGMMVLTGSRVVALEQDDQGKKVIFVNNGNEKMVRVETVVLATGYQPALDYGLQNAGVKYRKTGIIVDKTLQTTAKNIWAVGDAIGGESSTERANYQGSFLVNSLLSRSKTILNYSGFMRIIKTLPEIAVIGMNEDDLIKRDRKYNKVVVPLSDVTASKITDFSDGFVKLIADKSGKIVGATIMAPEAELMAGEIAVAVRHRLSALEIASTPHAVNSFAMAVKLAAKRLVKNQR